jgi:CheY-like chemotaxis protein
MQRTDDATRRVLVVDDNADLRDSLLLMLQHIGFPTEAARDGQHALDLQRARPAQILITDIFMPGTDGIETIEAFRRGWPDIKIVAISGGGAIATRDYLKLAPDIGADAILRKPFSIEELRQVLLRLGG